MNVKTPALFYCPKQRKELKHEPNAQLSLRKRSRPSSLGEHIVKTELLACLEEASKNKELMDYRIDLPEEKGWLDKRQIMIIKTNRQSYSEQADLFGGFNKKQIESVDLQNCTSSKKYRYSFGSFYIDSV